MKMKEIRDLIDFISESGLNEVNIETEDFKISVKREPKVKAQVIDKTTVQAATPTASSTPASIPTPEPVDSETSGFQGDNGSEDAKSKYVEINSPMIGTFYRAPNQEADPFINVGDSIANGQPVCIVEAMKLFNEIESEVSGTIVKVLVEDATPVEYDQPLFLVDPS